MLNIQVSTNDGGVGTIYTFPINPTDVDFSDSSDVGKVDTLHGAPAWQSSLWDGRPRSLFWNGGFGATTTVQPSIANQLSSMKAWKGSIRYFKFRSLDRILNWPTTSTWKKARVIDIITKVRPKGELRYDTIQMIIQPEV